MWLLVITPLALAFVAFVAFVEVANLPALGDAISQSGNNLMGRIEGGNPNRGSVITLAMLMGIPMVSAAALLYPALQTLLLCWWSGGLRFGVPATRTTLPFAKVYWRLYACPGH